MRTDHLCQVKKSNFYLIIVRDHYSIIVKKTEECLHKRLMYIEKLTEGKPEKKSLKGKHKNEVR